MVTPQTRAHATPRRPRPRQVRARPGRPTRPRRAPRPTGGRQLQGQASLSDSPWSSKGHEPRPHRRAPRRQRRPVPVRARSGQSARLANSARLPRRDDWCEVGLKARCNHLRNCFGSDQITQAQRADRDQAHLIRGNAARQQVGARLRDENLDRRVHTPIGRPAKGLAAVNSPSRFASAVCSDMRTRNR